MNIFYGRDGEPLDENKFGYLLSDLAYKHVAMTAIGKTIEVSTVWLGINHNFFGDGPPLIFETMVFGGPLDQLTMRYANEDAARAGHDQVVAAVREALRTPSGSDQ